MYLLQKSLKITDRGPDLMGLFNSQYYLKEQGIEDIIHKRLPIPMRSVNLLHYVCNFLFCTRWV